MFTARGREAAALDRMPEGLIVRLFDAIDGGDIRTLDSLWLDGKAEDFALQFSRSALAHPAAKGDIQLAFKIGQGDTLLVACSVLADGKPFLPLYLEMVKTPKGYRFVRSDPGDEAEVIAQACITADRDPNHQFVPSPDQIRVDVRFGPRATGGSPVTLFFRPGAGRPALVEQFVRRLTGAFSSGSDRAVIALWDARSVEVVKEFFTTVNGRQTLEKMRLFFRQQKPKVEFVIDGESTAFVCLSGHAIASTTDADHPETQPGEVFRVFKCSKAAAGFFLTTEAADQDAGAETLLAAEDLIFPVPTAIARQLVEQVRTGK